MDLIHDLDVLDKEATVSLNGDMGSFADAFFWALSSKYIWIPVGLLFLFLLIRDKKHLPVMKILIILAIVLTITVSDQLTSSLIKPLVARARPSHDLQISQLLHYVNDYHGGKYGFMSSHAANVFGTAVLGCYVLKNRIFTVFIFLLSLLVCYSRIYLGVHYLGDVVCGALVGSIVAYIFLWLLRCANVYFSTRPKTYAQFSMDFRRMYYPKQIV